MKKISILMCMVLWYSYNVHFVQAYDKSSVDKAAAFLSKKWYYYDLNGKKTRVHKLSWRSHGNNYEIYVNGRSIDPASLYDKEGKNILNPQLKNKAPRKIISGPEPGNMKGITEAHNFYRRKTGKGLPELVWDQGMAAYAQEWADYLKSANNCHMQHRQGSQRVKKYGENLAWASGKELEADEVIKMWYDEINNYNYDFNTCSGVCGHYTQVVWKDSKRLGCAMAKCANSEVWVCNYDPPGNWVGQKPY